MAEDEKPVVAPATDPGAGFEDRIKALEERLLNAVSDKFNSFQASVSKVTEETLPKEEEPLKSTVHQYPKPLTTTEDINKYTDDYIRKTIESVIEKHQTYNPQTMPGLTPGEATVYAMHCDNMTVEQIRESLPLIKDLEE